MAPLWSLAVEEQFYFVWPWVVLWCSLKGLKKAAIGIIVGAPILRALCTPLLSSRDPIYDLTPFRADLLAAGAFIAICAAGDPEWIQRNRRWSMVSLLAAGGLLIGLSTLHSFRLDANSESFNTFGYSLFVVIFASALIQALGLRKGLIRTILTCPPLRYMGWISYTFYLYQVLVLDEVSQHFHARAAVVVLGFILTGILSAVS